MNASADNTKRPFGDRVDDLRRELRLSKTDFAEELGISRSTFYQWTELEEPTREAVGAILLAFGSVDPEWLKSGEGEMYGSRTSIDYQAGALLVEGNDYFGEKETMDLLVRPDTSIRPGAGDNGFQLVEIDKDVIRLRLFKQFIYDLLGFWPPNTMEALRVIGNSMKPTFRDNQLVLVDPVHKLGDMINLRRYVLYIHDLRTGDWSPLAKRIATRPGGGFKIISDNRAYGEDDMILVPKEDGKLYDNATGQRIDMKVYGEVLWPRDEDKKERIQAATETLETLISEGSLQVGRQTAA